MAGLSSLFLQGMMPSFCRPGVKTRRPVNCITGVAGMADEVYEYVEAVQNAPLLRASSLKR